LNIDLFTLFSIFVRNRFQYGLQLVNEESGTTQSIVVNLTS